MLLIFFNDFHDRISDADFIDEKHIYCISFLNEYLSSLIIIRNVSPFDFYMFIRDVQNYVFVYM